MRKKNNDNIFIKKYREQQNHESWTTEEDSEFFAKYKVFKLASWFPEFLQVKNQILDFGSGSGLMSSYLAYYFNNSHVVGVDVSKKSVQVAQNIFPKLTFKKIGKKICFDDCHFDLVVASGVFHHIPFAKHSFWAKELFRVLKPGGKIIIFELNPLNLWTQWFFKNNPMEKNAQMLFSWYAKNIFRKQQENCLGVELKYIFFFQNWFLFLRSFEVYLEKVPFGGFYSLIITKKI